MELLNWQNDKYCVYLIQNIINHKIYIGVSSNPVERWKKHQANSFLKEKRYKKVYLYCAMNNRIKDFIFNVIEVYDSKEEALENETSLIIYFKYIGAKLYNMNEGGIMPPSRKGKKASLETKNKMSEFQRGRIRHPFSKEAKAKMSKSHLGQIPSNKGKPAPNRKFSDAEIKEIRIEYSSGLTSHRKLAKKFNVTKSVIAGIINNIYYSYVK